MKKQTTPNDPNKFAKAVTDTVAEKIDKSAKKKKYKPPKHHQKQK